MASPLLAAAARLAVLLAVLQTAVGHRNLQQDVTIQPVNNVDVKPTGQNAVKFQSVDSKLVIPNEYLVQLASGPSSKNALPAQAAAADARIQSIAAGPITILDFPGDVKIRVLQVTSGTAKTAIQALVDDPAVEIVAPNAKVNASAVQSVKDLWGLDRVDQADWRRYSYTTTGANTLAFVIDTGIWSTHQEFTGRILSGKSFISGTTPNDDNGHGTHCAGTIGGSTYGVAKGVKLVPVKVLDSYGSGSYAGVISGLNWAVAHTGVPNCRKVVSMSLGGPPYTLLDNAIRAAYSASVTVVVAAGNESDDACLYSPSRTAAAITVAASDIEDRRPYFSNYGRCVDIFAPGDNILSAYYGYDTNYDWLSGTSMATPHVAGLVARIISSFSGTTCPACPGITNPAACVWSLLKQNALVGQIADAGTGTPNLLAYLPTNK